MITERSELKSKCCECCGEYFYFLEKDPPPPGVPVLCEFCRWRCSHAGELPTFCNWMNKASAWRTYN